MPVIPINAAEFWGWIAARAVAMDCRGKLRLRLGKIKDG